VPEPDPAALALEVVAAGETDRGLRRGTNEDAFLVRSDIGLYVVADGAGGHSAGNVASAMATTSLAKYFDASEAEYRNRPDLDAFGLWSAGRRLSRAVQKANGAVIEIARSANKYRGMGTTIVCLLLDEFSRRLHVACVGDSRCYRLRGRALELLTHDHSILNDVLELYPELDDAALAKLPRKAITRALGMEERVRVSMRTLTAEPDDKYLLCSDGLSGELGEAVVEELLSQSTSPADIVRELVRMAKDKGGRDNITAVVVHCKPAAEPPTKRRETPVPKGHGTGKRGSSRPPKSRPRPPVESPTRASAGPPRPREASARKKASSSFVPNEASQPEIEVTGQLATGSDPEIIMIRAPRGSISDLSEPRISVVPVDSADAETVRALDDVAGALGPTEGLCPNCGEKLPGVVAVCPSCGQSQAELLSRS
jgi:protein phosphatase